MLCLLWSTNIETAERYYKRYKEIPKITSPEMDFTAHDMKKFRKHKASEVLYHARQP
ncbi:MAG: hypothetical protein R2813_10290 [Flavobacteriales bacterium]